MPKWLLVSPRCSTSEPALHFPDNPNSTRLLGTHATRATHCPRLRPPLSRPSELATRATHCPRLRPPLSRQSTLHALARHARNTCDALPTSTPSAFPTIRNPRACSAHTQHVRRTAHVYALRFPDNPKSTRFLGTHATRATHCPRLRPPLSRQSTYHALARHARNTCDALPTSTPSNFLSINI